VVWAVVAWPTAALLAVAPSPTEALSTVVSPVVGLAMTAFAAAFAFFGPGVGLGAGAEKSRLSQCFHTL
jgi:hypothetical protein